MGPSLSSTSIGTISVSSFGDKSGTEIKWEYLERCYGQHLGLEVWTVIGHNEVFPQRPAEVVGSINDLCAEIYPFTAGKSVLA